MTRAWALSIQRMQDAITAQIAAEKAANAGSLPGPLQSTDFEVIGTLGAKDQRLSSSHIRVFPPVNSKFDAEVTLGLEGTLEFPIHVRVRSLDLSATLNALREAVGLVIDGVNTDLTLGALCAGPASPAVLLGPLELEGAMASQEVTWRFIVRN